MGELVTLSAEAHERMRAMIANRRPGAGIRFSTKKSGCAGLAYELALSDGPEDDEEVVTCGEVTLFVPRPSILHLVGTRILVEREALAERFVFENPNEVDACGCGASFCVG